MRVCIPSVNYGDLLAVTLPGWVQVCPAGSITVVTSAEDLETQRVAAAAGVAVHVTDAWTRHDPTFQVPPHWQAYWRERGRTDNRPVMNKALALDEAFGFVPGPGAAPAPPEGELCLSADADCLPRGVLPDEARIRPQRIYGCLRYEGKNDLTRGPEIVLKGRVRQSQHRHASCVAGGYFQMFRYVPGLRFGSYPGADGYDYDFAFQFARGIVLEGIHVLHFGETHLNWWGRVTPRFEPTPESKQP